MTSSQDSIVRWSDDRIVNHMDNIRKIMETRQDDPIRSHTLTLSSGACFFFINKEEEDSTLLRETIDEYNLFLGHQAAIQRCADKTADISPLMRDTIATADSVTDPRQIRENEITDIVRQAIAESRGATLVPNLTGQEFGHAHAAAYSNLCDNIKLIKERDNDMSNEPIELIGVITVTELGINLPGMTHHPAGAKVLVFGSEYTKVNNMLWVNEDLIDKTDLHRIDGSKIIEPDMVLTIIKMYKALNEEDKQKVLTGIATPESPVDLLKTTRDILDRRQIIRDTVEEAFNNDIGPATSNETQESINRGLHNAIDMISGMNEDHEIRSDINRNYSIGDIIESSQERIVRIINERRTVGDTHLSTLGNISYSLVNHCPNDSSELRYAIIDVNRQSYEHSKKVQEEAIRQALFNEIIIARMTDATFYDYVIGMNNISYVELKHRDDDSTGLFVAIDKKNRELRKDSGN